MELNGVKKRGEQTLRGSVKGMSKHTFVRGYKVNSQMNTHKINGVNLSSRTGRMIQSIYDALEEDS